MKPTDFYTNRIIELTDWNGERHEYTSIPDMITDWNGEDLKNSEQWATAFHGPDDEMNDNKSCVFFCHRFDHIGEIVDSELTKEAAEIYAEQLNRYFAITENMQVVFK